MKKEFIIGQVLTIISTVLGVYLAATTGFKLAIDFENGKSMKDTFYVSQALYNEASDNTTNMLKWGEQFQVSPQIGFKMKEKREDYTLEKFVWESMKDSSSTFEIPSKFLSQIQKFYSFSERQLGKMIASPMSSSLGTPLAKRSKDLKLLLDEFKVYLDKEKKKIEDMGFEL